MSEPARLAGETDTLALLGGRPVRERMLPYGRQHVDESDIRAVVETLRGDWLTNGPGVVRFEEAFAAQVGARFAVAVSSGTAALHAAAHVAGLGPGDEVILSPLTFLATANCILYCGATPVFADIDPATLTLDRCRSRRRFPRVPRPSYRCTLPGSVRTGSPAPGGGPAPPRDHRGPVRSRLRGDAGGSAGPDTVGNPARLAPLSPAA